MHFVRNYLHAFQSSFSQWSHSIDESENALTGKRPGGYAFHTAKENDAWWAVDLGIIRPVCMIRIFKRDKFEKLYQSKDIEILVSSNLSTWRSLGSPRDTGSFGPFEIVFRPMAARYIKISVKENYLTLSEIEIYEDDTAIPFHGAFIRKEKYSAKFVDAFLNGGYEQQEITWAQKLIASDDRVLELGASIGVMSSVLLAAMPGLNYCAVEANPDLIPVMRENHTLNGVSCTILEGAVSKNPGLVDFYQSPNFVGSRIVDSTSALDAIKVNSLSFEDLVINHCPNFLICDCEGAEYEIFTDQKIFSGINKIVIEMHCGNGKPESLYSFFIAGGFKALTPPPNSNEQYVGCFTRA